MGELKYIDIDTDYILKYGLTIYETSSVMDYSKKVHTCNITDNNTIIYADLLYGYGELFLYVCKMSRKPDLTNIKYYTLEWFGTVDDYINILKNYNHMTYSSFGVHVDGYHTVKRLLQHVICKSEFYSSKYKLS